MDQFTLGIIIGGVLGILLTLFIEGIIHIYLIDKEERGK